MKLAVPLTGVLDLPLVVSLSVKLGPVGARAPPWTIGRDPDVRRPGEAEVLDLVAAARNPFGHRAEPVGDGVEVGQRVGCHRTIEAERLGEELTDGRLTTVQAFLQ
jgi:hypothetical protein